MKVFEADYVGIQMEIFKTNNGIKIVFDWVL